MLKEAFEANGFSVTSQHSEANVIVINSCTVTAESDRKTRQAVRHYKTLGGAVIVLCGCMPQAFNKSAEQLSQADIVTGNTSPAEIPLLVKEYLKSKKRILNINNHSKEEAFNTPTVNSFDERTRAFMKIEDGCERYCTYCIIPKARGFVRSKSIEEIKKEAAALAHNGFSEIVLVGINLSAYGKDNGLNLLDAVKAVCNIEKVKRVRLGSLEPDHMTNEMLKGLSQQAKFCPQFHLSLQSGCDNTLKRMNRHYDTAFYRDLITRIRNNFNNPSITTDIMVGFAGETEQDFLNSVEFLKEIGFAKTHVFAYSRREGTAAYSYKDQIDKKTKAIRSKIMIDAASECEQKFLRSQIGKTVSVLFETHEDGCNYGYSENYSRVKLKHPTSLEGEIVTVKITNAENDYLIAEIV
jgi:threonylcarbamoyladenosine tRNA methylthiotransferase MtaB